MIDIAVRDLVKEYEVGQPVLNGLTFQVDTGERVGILGRNGAGKTTLFRILTGQGRGRQRAGDHPRREAAGAHLPDPRLPRRVHRGGRAAHGL
ncbi:MAG: ATP-binding cassette domain-containing protein [Evtepia sp.]